MDNITSSIITPVVQTLMEPVKKHLGILVSSTKYVTDMKEKMNWLNLAEKDIRHNWEEAVARNHEVSNLVVPWLKKVEKVNKEAQSIPTSGIGCFNIAKRYKAGKQSYKILGEIQDLETQKSEIKFTNAQKPLAEVVSTSTAWPSTSTRDGTQNNFKSRDVIYNAILKSLQPQNDSEKMIAICGMAGVGKTTMMEQLEKEVRDSKMFDRVVKVVLGEETNPFALQSAIAEYIREDLNEKTTSARADRLSIVFNGMSQKEKKKVLVIMDDLWNAIDLKDFGLSPLPDGFKLLFTSRFERVCNQMGVKTCSIFNIGVLNEAEARILFLEEVQLLDGHDPGRQKIGEDIVKKCSGLPIAIVTIARCLRGNIKEEWEKALERLENDDLQDLESITRRIFEISYENIKEDGDKSIFILCGLFPDDFDIRTEDLLRYGWALRFFKDASNLRIARRDMKICVNNLLRANLLTKSDRMGCVKMHDLVRAFVLSKISEVKQVSVVNLDNISQQRFTKDANESYHRILLKCTGFTEFPTNFNYPNLSMLMLMDGHKLLRFPENIYDRMEKLQVVSFENMRIPSLLLTFEHSTKLRTLCLRSCGFINDDVSLLGSLSNLETLSFIDCKISSLPSSIGELKKLKLLDLTGCVQLCIDNGVFQSLVSLEELYMRGYEHSPIRFTKANYDELEILSHRLFVLEVEFYEKPKNMSFKNLERFKISIGCQLEEMEYGEKNFFRNTIQLVGDCSELLECKISELFSKTEELHLQVNEMNHLEDVILRHHSFSDLTVLHISECADLTCPFTVDMASGLKKLERLTISECPIMRTLVVENSKWDFYWKLSFMSLIDLPNMISLWDNNIELPEMVELILVGLPMFESIYPHSHNTRELQSLLNKKVVIPKLEKLNISNMENLKHIWSCETTDQNNDSMLRKIKVRKCDNLINLFPSNPLPLLNHLEELEVKECGSIEVLFNMEFESVCGTREYDSSKLRRIRVDGLGKLKVLWRMKGVNTCDIHVKCFKGVENIMITSCPHFTNIFTPTTINFDLGRLTDYVTDNSGEEINDKLKGEISEMDEYTSNIRYTSYLLNTCHHLQHLELKHDKRVKEVVFEMDSHQPLRLPYLERLTLSGLEETSHVWKYNWNKFSILHHPPLQLPFQNLTSISLKFSHKIKYLFSPLMATYLSNLKEVYIIKCAGIEEVISSRDDENEENTTSATSHQNTTFFPHLDSLHLKDLRCLKSIDGGDQTRSRSGKISFNLINIIHGQSQLSGQVSDACWSLCQYPTRIKIYHCDALSSLVPWYSVGQMKRLQELEIGDCETMKEVFESESSTSYNVDEESAPGPTLVVPQLINLKSVYIENCDVLSHVFTFSTLKSLSQLKDLKVESCKAMKVIVKEENETSSKDIVVFPRLETLKLDHLPNLIGFFLGMNEFQWPLLHDVMINDCPQLMAFTLGQSKTPKLKYISTHIGKYSLEGGLNFQGMITKTTFPISSSDLTLSKGMPWSSFHNLIEIKIWSEINVERTIIPSNVLLQLEKLEKIDLRLCYGVEEVFEGSGFNESQTTPHVVTIPNLTQVDLMAMDNLKYLWKSNRSMVLEFPNLTTLSIELCDKLEHVFTCSMVGSLVQLQDLQITGCLNIEVIVKEEEECDHVKVNELPRLKSLILEGLPELKGFCLGKDAFSLPALDTLEIVDCPALKGFTEGNLSTPELKVIETTYGKWYVKPDLNSFVKNKQGEGNEF